MAEEESAMKKRWTGTARIERGEIKRVRFEPEGGDEAIGWIGERSFMLKISKRRKIEIDLSKNDVRILPEKEHSGAWETFEDDPLAASFVSSAPGPHVPVKLFVGTIRNGDHVIVDGEAEDEDEDEVRAHLVAVGDVALDVVERIDTKQRANAPRHSRARPPFGFALIATVLAIAATLVAISIPLSPATLDLAAFAAGMFVIGVHRIARSAIIFRSAKGRVDRTPFGAAFSISFGGTCVLLGGLLILGDWPGHLVDGKQANGSAFPLAMWSAYFVLLVVDLIRSGRNSERLSRVALAAPPLEVGRWGSVVGNVRSHEERAAVYSLIEETWWEGSGSNPREESQHQSPFDVQVGERRMVHVAPHGQACWATDAVEESSARASSTKTKAIVERSEIPRGARVLAVGRAKLEGDVETLAPTGSESLILFASEEHDPRSVLRRRRALWMFVLLLTSVFAVASGALAIIQPGMPPANVPDTN